MPATNDTAVVTEQPTKEVETKSTTKEVEKEKPQVAEKKVEEGDADKAAGGDGENGDKAGGKEENGDKSGGDSGKKVDEKAESGGDVEEKVEDTGKGKENGSGEGKVEENGSGDVKSEKGDDKPVEKVKTPSKEDYETGASLLAQGKRHLYVKDFPSAVTTLSLACAKISAEHGQLADDCADGYYYYGSALLELAREEMAVLGEPEANKEGEEEGDDDEEEGEGEEEGGADETLEASKVEEEGEKKEGEGKEGEEKMEEGEGGKEKQRKGEDEENMNVNDLQLAWEMFDLARVIYERQNDEKKLADTYLKLGEVAMESENYDGAVQDMNKCLTIQHKILSADNRAIAETLFQLGVASSLCNQFEEAIKYFTNAGVVLERRIRTLTSSKAVDPEVVKKDPFYTVEKEVAELKALLPEIKDKIADMEDFKREALKALREDLGNRLAGNKDGGASTSSAAGGSGAAEGSSSAVSAASPSKASGPVNDISHLVRKKRKAEEVVSEKETNEAKKPNVETTSS
ncbi:LOW QUALITY PROTEIN: histone-binding protein N1/N2 [Nilaparvata lugens]|uniref:LOW QUALITY PROTEIN: histone-binding protein N1/N2 n=1 Tax=Nilaparvata lugens TaxID=108931 RepID=UPI00193D3DC1|nr:LOW QUALITY PROTEIN: histone-binding protein N1/N2 [Nilaparvata lugens]